MEHHPLVGVDGDMVDGTVPEFFIEGQGQGVQLAQFKHHAADGDGVCFHSIDRNIDVEWQLPDILEYFRTVFLADAEYRQVKKDMQEYLIAKQTVEHILGIDRQK